MVKFMVSVLCFLTLLGINDSIAQKLNKEKWVDSVYKRLTLEQKIGQLFMVAAYSGGENKNDEAITQLVEKQLIGGLIFMQGTAEAQIALTNKYQAMSHVKLLIAMDAEWGLGMRLTGVKDFPKQMLLGAANDSALVYKMGAAIAEQFKRVGAHINFAPVIDVNNNADNPVINFRAFGDNVHLVAHLGIAYMLGLQQNGIGACAKHFPGHGDVNVDSHLDLPVIHKTKQQLTNLELAPFKSLIDAGVNGVMIAHLAVPALTEADSLPTTLSYNVVTELLQQEMQFDGLIFTDALNMKGVTKHYKDGETDLKAFLAGNDVLLFSQDVPLAIQKIKQALAQNSMLEQRLARSVKKILAAKYDYKLWDFQPISAANATADVNKQVAAFSQEASEKALTLLNSNEALRNWFKHNEGIYWAFNLQENDEVVQQLKAKFPLLKIECIPAQISSAQAIKLITKYKSTSKIIWLGLHGMSRYPGKDGQYGISADQQKLIKNVIANHEYAFPVVMGNPYILNQLIANPEKARAIVAYADDIYARNTLIRFLQQEIIPKGVLPFKLYNEHK